MSTSSSDTPRFNGDLAKQLDLFAGHMSNLIRYSDFTVNIAGCHTQQKSSICDFIPSQYNYKFLTNLRHSNVKCN